MKNSISDGEILELPTRYRCEAKAHRELKYFADRSMVQAGFTIRRMEHGNCDLVGHKDGKVTCVEIQTTPNHAVFNSLRNLLAGADRTVVVAANERVRKKISEQVSKRVPLTMLGRVRVTTPENLFEALM